MGFAEMAYIQDFTPAHITGMPFLLLLAMANKTDPLGHVIASVDELSRDMRVSPCTIQRLTTSLVEAGELEESDSGGLPASPPRYRLVRVREASERGTA